MKPYYEHAGITLFHADWRECELGHSDLLLTDPPYRININKSHRLSVSRGFGSDTWDLEVVAGADISFLRSIANDAIIWGGNYYELPPALGFLVWDKCNDGRDFADVEFAWSSRDSVARIFRFRPMNMDGGKQHPTQKPLALMKWCISLVPTAKTLVDPYCGSGTSLVAAKAMGMTAVGVEREESYCEIAAKRLSQEVFEF